MNSKSNNIKHHLKVFVYIIINLIFVISGGNVAEAHVS